MPRQNGRHEFVWGEHSPEHQFTPHLLMEGVCAKCGYIKETAVCRECGGPLREHFHPTTSTAEVLTEINESLRAAGITLYDWPEQHNDGSHKFEPHQIYKDACSVCGYIKDGAVCELCGEPLRREFLNPEAALKAMREVDDLLISSGMTAQEALDRAKEMKRRREEAEGAVVSFLGDLVSSLEEAGIQADVQVLGGNMSTRMLPGGASTKRLPWSRAG